MADKEFKKPIFSRTIHKTIKNGDIVKTTKIETVPYEMGGKEGRFVKITVSQPAFGSRAARVDKVTVDPDNKEIAMALTEAFKTK